MHNKKPKDLHKKKTKIEVEKQNLITMTTLKLEKTSTFK